MFHRSHQQQAFVSFLNITRFQNRRTKWKKQNPGLDVNSPTIPTTANSSSVGMHSVAAAAYAACAASFYSSQQHHQQLGGSSTSTSSANNPYPLISPLYAASLYANARKFTWPILNETDIRINIYKYSSSSFCSRLCFFFAFSSLCCPSGFLLLFSIHSYFIGRIWRT